MADGFAEGYVDVAERIRTFYTKYPDGVLRGSHSIEQVGDKTFVVFRAEAWRNGEDPVPATGHAWEPFPGQTNFTRDSELMNAETSAWGRAIAALGFEVHQGVASAQEVRNRSGGTTEAQGSGASPAQLKYLGTLAKDGGCEAKEQEAIKAYAESLTKKQVSAIIDKLVVKKDDPDQDERKLEAGQFLGKLTEEATGWLAKDAADIKSDAPVELEPETANGEPIPF